MSIPHLHSLPPEEFIHAVRNLCSYTITEKLDGANLAFGFTKDGEFYTSRESKNGERIFSAKSYKHTAANNGFRSAHAALQSIEHLIQPIVGNGNAIEIEILYGQQPNAIKYGGNYIVFLRTLEGDMGRVPDPHIIESLERLFRGYTAIAEVDITYIDPNAYDISPLYRKPVIDRWSFSKAATIIPDLKLEMISKHYVVDALEKWLDEVEPILKMTNKEVLSLNLNSIPRTDRDVAKHVRESIKAMFQSQKDTVSRGIIGAVHRNIAPRLQSVELDGHDIHGIEGIVFLDPKTQFQFKVVDTETFTEANQFFHTIRNQIKNTFNKQHPFENAKLVSDGDLYNRLLNDISEAIDIPELSSYTKIKPFLKARLGSTKTDTAKNVAGGRKFSEDLRERLSTNIVYGHILTLIIHCRRYTEEWEEYSHTLPNGQTIKYSYHVHLRNLMTFTEVENDMHDMMCRIRLAESFEDLIEAIYEKQLNDLHNA